MNSKALKTLEYDKIINMLSEYAQSRPAKERCAALLPSDDMETITLLQKQTSDALSRLFTKGSVSFSGNADVTGALKRLELGASLSAPELLRMASLLRAASNVRSYGVRDITEEEYDSLDAMFTQLNDLPTLRLEIERCIISEEEVADSASPGLRDVRRRMASVSSKIQGEMTSCLQTYKSYLQDAVITMRDGSYCLPVKSEHRSHVSGVIHDQSSTGSTVFIEPASVMRLCNELRQLTLEERKEIEKVLATLSSMCASQTEALRADCELLTELDYIFARAAFSKSYNGSEPVFNEKGYINIKKGRHPLISKDKVVPIDVYLGNEFDLLIITGPNTGGKTVTLKTIGLFTLMGQAGLHIPAFDGSSLSVFTEVWADIGDEQSIEQSLSTFSSHMTNIAPILEVADEKSLVLFDELGAGTDPTEGAALATSILSYLHGLGIRTVATTHYAELKLYALSTPGVSNACCEFDVETLRPTYRLLIGIPGRSNAFAISGKLGIPEHIIDDARARISSEDTHFEDVISQLEKERQALERDMEALEKKRGELSSRESAVAMREEKLAAKQDKILKEAEDKASAMLADTKAFVDETIRVVNKHTSGGDIARLLEKERTAVREKMNKTVKPKDVAPAAPKKAADPKKLKVGSTVMVNSMNVKGTVLTLPDSHGQLKVQMGILTTQTGLDDITILSEPETTLEGGRISTGSRGLGMTKAMNIASEINLIGKTVDEALPLLDKYLDDAYLAHVPMVRVVHGKGSGILKNAVHRHLKGMKNVASFRLGEFGEGDAGVTIVEFR